VSHIPRQVAELSTSHLLTGEFSSVGTVPTPSVNTHTHTHGHACVHKGVVVGERADPIHCCACRSHTHTCQHVNLHTWSGLSSLKTEMMINRDKCCQRSRASSLVHGPSSPLSPYRFPTLSLELSLSTSLSSQDPSLSLARTHTDTQTHTHTHTHTHTWDSLADDSRGVHHMAGASATHLSVVVRGEKIHVIRGEWYRSHARTLIHL
jgi:hypothetical protein